MNGRKSMGKWGFYHNLYTWSFDPSYILGGGFKYFLFSPLPGEMIQFDYMIFFKGVETTT